MLCFVFYFSFYLFINYILDIKHNVHELEKCLQKLNLGTEQSNNTNTNNTTTNDNNNTLNTNIINNTILNTNIINDDTIINTNPPLQQQQNINNLNQNNNNGEPEGIMGEIETQISELLGTLNILFEKNAENMETSH